MISIPPSTGVPCCGGSVLLGSVRRRLHTAKIFRVNLGAKYLVQPQRQIFTCPVTAIFFFAPRCSQFCAYNHHLFPGPRWSTIWAILNTLGGYGCIISWRKKLKVCFFHRIVGHLNGGLNEPFFLLYFMILAPQDHIRRTLR